MYQVVVMVIILGSCLLTMCFCIGYSIYQQKKQNNFSHHGNSVSSNSKK